jgi:hypothetical protein
VRCTENAAHNFGQKHLKVWAASVDEGLVTLPYGSDEPFEFLDGEFEKNGPATSRCSRRGIAARLSSVVIPVCDTSTSKSTHREHVISSGGKFKPWLRYVMEGPSKMGGMKTF